MSQAWLPLERSEPDLRLRSLNVVALLHGENEKARSLGNLNSRQTNQGFSNHPDYPNPDFKWLGKAHRDFHRF